MSDTQKLTGYMETEWRRISERRFLVDLKPERQLHLTATAVLGNHDNIDWGLHVLGGQAWSFATLYKIGLIPRQENVPLTIDAQYVVGFNWERQPELRVVNDFDDHKIWAGVSLEQTLFGSTGGAGPNCLTGAAVPTATGGGTLEYTQCGGSNVNIIQTYSDKSLRT